MNTGQTMITVFAMILLSFLILRVNNMFLQTNNTLYTSKFEVLGYTLAQSMIQEIERLDFDQNTVSAAISDSNSLSATLGKETGETTYDTFNDIDDYDDYTRTDTIPAHSGTVFNIRCTVEYVLPTTPDVATASKTWQKKITVYVASPYMTSNAHYSVSKTATNLYSQLDTIKLSQVYSYWIFK